MRVCANRWQACTGRRGMLSTRTGQLVAALRAPQVRGRWGEIQLERVVELAGMVKHCDFDTQVADARACAPTWWCGCAGGKQIVVDAKVPFAAYLDAAQRRPDTPGYRDLLARHARQLRTHVDQLADKAYWESFDPTSGVRGAVRARRRVPRRRADRRLRAARARLLPERDPRHPDHAHGVAADHRAHLAPGGAVPRGRDDPPTRPGAVRPARGAVGGTSTGSAPNSARPSTRSTSPSRRWSRGCTSPPASSTTSKCSTATSPRSAASIRGRERSRSRILRPIQAQSRTTGHANEANLTT